MRIVPVLAACLVLLGAGSAWAEPIDTGREPDCSEYVPIALELDETERLTLRVLVMLDGVAQADAERVMAVAARPYEAINVGLEVRYEAFPAIEAADPPAHHDAARNLHAGRRPAGTDVVYVMTAKDLVSDGPAGDGVAGQADCIGGIAFADRGYAVGEYEADDPWVETGLFYDTSAKIAAHEIAHLLGAHHHYANCAEAPATDHDRGGCTLLINDVGLAELAFSTVNGAIVRAHLVKSAGRAPVQVYEPPPEPAHGEGGSPPPRRPEPDEQAAAEGGSQPASQPSPTTTASSSPNGKPTRSRARSARCEAALKRVDRRRNALWGTPGGRKARRLRAVRAERLRDARRAARRVCRQ